MTKLNNQKILITGGASGIGFRLAAGAIKKGATVIIWDIDAESLERATSILGNRAHGYVIDITDRTAVYKTADTVRDEVGVVDVLINNAGIVTGKSFLDLPDEMIEKTFQVNTISHFWTARAFLPDMLKRNRGHIVTIASAGGLVGVAKLTDYCASKFAAIGFDDSLRAELKRDAPGVRTTAVMPFFINTGMFEGVSTRFPWLLPILEEQDVADSILRGIERNRERVFLPGIVQPLLAIKALPTPMVDTIMSVLGMNMSMDAFKGRKKN